MKQITIYKKTLTIDVGSKLFDSLDDFLSDIRDEFDNYKIIVREKCSDSNYKDLLQPTKMRSIRLIYTNGHINESISFFSKKKLKIEIIDTLITKLRNRVLL